MQRVSELSAMGYPPHVAMLHALKEQEEDLLQLLEADDNSDVSALQDRLAAIRNEQGKIQQQNNLLSNTGDPHVSEPRAAAAGVVVPYGAEQEAVALGAHLRFGVPIDLPPDPRVTHNQALAIATPEEDAQLTSGDTVLVRLRHTLCSVSVDRLTSVSACFNIQNTPQSYMPVPCVWCWMFGVR